MKYFGFNKSFNDDFKCICCGLNLSLVQCFFELVSILFAIVPDYGMNT